MAFLMTTSPPPNRPVLGRILLEARGIAVRVRDRHLLAGTWWRIREGERWAVLGPNGSGKSSLVRALAGLAPTSAGVIRRHRPLAGRRAAAIGYVSSELHEEWIGREEARAESRRSPDGEGLTVGEALSAAAQAPADLAELIDRFGLACLLARPVRVLSSGQMRRLLIARALASRPGLLILDEPFDGLDAEARATLSQTLSALGRTGVPLILVTHRLSELPAEITHVLLVRDGRVVAQGPRGQVPIPAAAVAGAPPAGAGARRAEWRAPAAGPPLVELREVTVRYGDTVALDRVSWTMRRGERWAVLGPNGAGKSTLLELIGGDNLQAYSNDVRLFGRRRGDCPGGGIALWEVRRRLGVVSQRLQTAYRPGPFAAGEALPTAREVIQSGFYDSIGLYRRPDEAQRAAAESWIARLGLAPLADRPYNRLSYGERRLVLIGRAMVKSPELLVLDEPCEGLDPGHRRAVLGLLERIGLEDGVSLLYVTHREEELPGCLTHLLRLRGGRVVEG